MASEPARPDLDSAQTALAAGNYGQAFTEYLQLAEKDPLAMFTVGLFYQNGWGQTVNQVAACQWFEKAANREIIAAQHFLGDCLADNVHRRANKEEALEWYSSAAKLGHVTSLCSITALYIYGKNGLQRDPTKGLTYCEQAAQAGNLPSQLQLGRYLLNGDESIRDIHAAEYWFKSAAQRGSLPAFYYLGVINRDHTDDALHAIYWFERAAAEGYLSAYFPLAQLYFNQLEIEKQKKPPAHQLAKSYLWLSAASQRIENKSKLMQVNKMLVQVKRIMPESWVSALNEKVNLHLAQFSEH